MTGVDILLALGVLAGASVVQALAGFGFALLAMPLLSVVLGPTPALAVVSLVSIVNSGATAVHARRDADRSAVKRQSLAAFVGMPIGLLVLATVPERGMQFLIAFSVALAATALALRIRIPPVGPRGEVAAGLTSGVLATSTGTSGPPIVICLQSRGLPAATVRATLASQFLATGWVSVVLLALTGHIDGDDVVLAVLSLPVLLLSWRVGARSFTRVSQSRYDAIVVTLLLGAAAVAVLNAW